MIVDWIMENIVPNMAENSKIKCDFGEIYKYPRTRSTVKTYHFYVYSELNKFYSGGEGKPEEEVREVLKSNGFKWAPSQGAWQRQITANGKWALKRTIEELKKMEETV